MKRTHSIIIHALATIAVFAVLMIAVSPATASAADADVRLAEYEGQDDGSDQFAPQRANLVKLKSGRKCFTAKWVKRTDHVSGYQLQYALNKSFSSGAKTLTISNNQTVTRKVKSLKAKKKYYVRVRTYFKADGENYYSKWSGYKTVKTKAAKKVAWQALEDDTNYDTYVRKAGDYYLKLESKYNNKVKAWCKYIYYSQKRYSGYRYLGCFSLKGCTNGRQIITCSANSRKVMKVDLETGKKKTIKQLKKTSGSQEWAVEAVYGNTIYVSFNEYLKNVKLYVLNSRTKAFRHANMNVNIHSQKGSYVIANSGTRWEASRVSTNLYRTTSSGLRFIRTLSSNGQDGWFIGKWIYYVEYNDYNFRKCTMYRCRINGSAKKKIASFSSNQSDIVVVRECDSKGCKVQKSGGYYRYSFKTKRMKRLKNG